MTTITNEWDDSNKYKLEHKGQQYIAYKDTAEQAKGQLEEHLSFEQGKRVTIPDDEVIITKGDSNEEVTNT